MAYFQEYWEELILPSMLENNSSGGLRPTAPRDAGAGEATWQISAHFVVRRVPWALPARRPWLHPLRCNGRDRRPEPRRGWLSGFPWSQQGLSPCSSTVQSHAAGWSELNPSGGMTKADVMPSPGL